jgi:hypothetical protein
VTPPARPLVLERDTDLRHCPPFRQEDVLDRPVEAAGPAQPGDVPAARDDSSEETSFRNACCLIGREIVAERRRIPEVYRLLPR